MPVRYTFSGNLFRIYLEGSYEPEDIIETFRAALDDPLFPKDARLLLDVRKSSELATRDSQKIRDVAEYFAENAERVGNRCAILADSPIHVGLGRMGAAFAGFRGAIVQVHTVMDDAISWLGADVKEGIE